MKSKIMKFFSDLGRSLMMPVAALAACGIILGITSALLKTQVQDAVPFLTASVPLFIITTLNKVSGIVFTLLPVLFAISIAFGLAKEDKGVAAFAGFIGYYTFLVASSNSILWRQAICCPCCSCVNDSNRTCDASYLGSDFCWN